MDVQAQPGHGAGRHRQEGPISPKLLSTKGPAFQIQMKNHLLPWRTFHWSHKAKVYANMVCMEVTVCFPACGHSEAHRAGCRASAQGSMERVG